MALDSNRVSTNAIQDDVDDDTKAEQKVDSTVDNTKHQFVSAEKAPSMMKQLCKQGHSSQTEYFLNVYWNTYCKDHKDEIFDIFCKFVEIDKYGKDIPADTVTSLQYYKIYLNSNICYVYTITK